jgi:hypothetical protein
MRDHNIGHLLQLREVAQALIGLQQHQERQEVLVVLTSATGLRYRSA